MPDKIGPYPVVSKIGGGGMGVVYKGRDESLHRFVAIKVLTENLNDDRSFVQRFEREAQAAAALSHPNIVQIYATGKDEAGHPYFVMEFVNGQSLEQLLRSEGQIGNPRASQLILQAAHGLAAAHDRGIIHRDIKPANLMLDDHGILKIADFGLALPTDAQTQLTGTGMMVGTHGYISPEQFDGAKADPLTDIYALGVTYYMLLTGTPPFRGESPLALMKQIVDGNPPDVITVNPNVDPESRRILGKMIAKDRSQRYPNCHELVADLENLLAGLGVRSTTAGLARTPVTAANLDAMSAPTLVISQAETQPNVAITSPGVPVAAAPMAAAAITSPGIPMGGRPTDPAMAAPVTKKKSALPVLMVVLFAFILVGGGAVAAVWYGAHSFLAKHADLAKFVTRQPAPAPSAANRPTNPASNPPQSVLLSQAITPSAVAGAAKDAPAMAADSATPTATSASSEASAAPGASAQPVRQTVTSESASRIAAAPPATRSIAREPEHRRLSGVVVASIGDRALLGAVSGVLRSEAEQAGVKAVDAHDLPATEDLLGGHPAVRDLIARLRDNGYAVLMLARIEPTGERELSYYGHHDTAYTAWITVVAYDLATGQPIGTPESASLSYTSINIETQSEDVVGPLARSCARMIAER